MTFRYRCLLRPVVAATLLLAATAPLQAQTFGPITFHAVGLNNAPLGIALADVNGDGRLDLLTSNDGAQVSLLLALGNGTFGPPAVYPTGTAGAVALQVGDVNRDGRPDVVMAGGSSGGLLLGMPNGTLTPPMAQFALNMTANPGALALGDVNGDGRLDIATAYGASTTSGRFDQVQVLLGRPNNTFAPAVVYSLSTGSYPEAVALGDVNGDGYPDLATANSGNNTVGLLLGQGNGTFGPATNYPLGPNTTPLGVALADFNNDGRLDVATANNAGNVSILLSTGSALGPASQYLAGSYPVGIALSDVNNDGLPDVVTAGFGGNVLSVLPGAGAGTFGTGQNYPTGPASAPISVAIGDVDGDGAPDLVSANVNAAAVGVMLSQAPVLTLTGPPSGSAGAALTLAGRRLAGATAVAFRRGNQLVASVPASAFTSTNYTATPNTIGLLVPASLAPGPYTVAIATANGTSPTVAFTVTAPLSLAGRPNTAGVEVSPNPAQRSITVRVPAAWGGSLLRLSLHDALGREVRTEQGVPPALTLDLHGLAPGVYQLRGQAGQVVFSRRVVVN
ncbi:T9SS type A sorting domain-containing protein [Hymenobacter sp. DH14]|uniref:T9SS type A sorting domain-containing protein n=1 Tax=Hymenobacter cyanobacteriorum TaxID=2926463 RepID=A0A9X2AGD9_9BACT|nr:T9SS type A sorting domain-containing protein [Hymenobacter cyanobacteriorum]MCI1189141.1 T9SS type A sorting domain-containing protein [Hymenobacter cyanobacteriorum]